MVDLGTYTGAVLSAYAATFVLLGTIIGASLLRARRVRRDLEAQEARNA